MANTLAGSCLCGAVTYQAHGEPQRFLHCHCSRCRRSSGTGHASNVMVVGELDWTSGADKVKRYKVPDAKRFTSVFCTQCGAPLPREAKANGIVVIPAGSLQTDPGLTPQARIFCGSRTAWSCSDAALPEFAEYPT